MPGVGWAPCVCSTLPSLSTCCSSGQPLIQVDTLVSTLRRVAHLCARPRSGNISWLIVALRDYTAGGLSRRLPFERSGWGLVNLWAHWQSIIVHHLLQRNAKPSLIQKFCCLSSVNSLRLSDVPIYTKRSDFLSSQVDIGLKYPTRSFLGLSGNGKKDRLKVKFTTQVWKIFKASISQHFFF